ncbi:hypothetical protein EGM88_10885 [Aureibaculum marinum]|uniref:Uncharacterized protein n=1 Tax=Aureibaculum marinum TaxID=2487930 RepID=A0A3N4NNA3_9FLAO|nr:hypothetical protein [Aureibaculum marinum]RPD95967.1 hypothetical protein EGM88_10885 [Aureibaculum marinum]
MIKKINYLFVFVLLLICTGCFEIVEEVNLNDDGSGKVTLTLNLSRSRTKINSLMLLDSVNNYKVPTEKEIRKHFSDIVKKVKSTEEISNVANSIDLENYIFTLSCHFNNVEALNTVVSNFSSKEEAKRIKNHKHFSYNTSEQLFTRSYHYDLANEIKKTKMEDREVFKTASITTIYRFPKPIVFAKNDAAKISKSKKAIMLKVSAQDIINQKKSIKNQITLQK